MALSFTSVAYLAVIASGLTLFTIGHPQGEAQPSATTPGLAKAAAPAPRSMTAAGFTLSSVSVDLPTSDRSFPAGPGVDVVQANCVTCHSAGMVANQPHLTRAAWEAEVNKMRAVYKAPVAAEDVPAIVAYLASTKGAP